MRILLTESDIGAAEVATATLEAAGHEVLRCVEPDAPAFPCVGLADGDCPVEGRVERLAVQVAGAIRRFDRDAEVIDVAVLDGQAGRDRTDQGPVH